MAMGDILQALGALTIAYLFYKLVTILLIYTQPSKLPRYCHNNAWALVTGSSDGIGLGYAQELLSQGFNVILHGRNAKKLQARKELLEKEYPNKQVIFVVADATKRDPKAIEELVRAIRDKPVTILVNNVGGIPLDPKWRSLASSSATDLEKTLNINAWFPAEITRAMLPVLEANTPACIINMSSMTVVGIPHAVVYAASKAFNVSFSKSLRYEMMLENRDIDVQCIMVGDVNSGGNEYNVSFLVPSSRTMAKSALNRLGCRHGLVTAYFGHFFYESLLYLVPSWAFDYALVAIVRRRLEDQAAWKAR